MRWIANAVLFVALARTALTGRAFAVSFGIAAGDLLFDLLSLEPPETAHQPGGLLIVAITAYWQHVMVDDRACPVVTW